MSALRRDPGRQQQRRKGALGAEPKFTLGTDMASLQAQQARTQAAIDKRGGKAGNYQGRLDQINQAMAGMQQPAPTDQAPAPTDPTSFTGVTDTANDVLSSTFQQMQNQGAFNPGDYSAQRQKAEQVAMDSFNRSMQPKFDRDEQAFRQQMAEQGIPENSEGYRLQYQQMKEAQNAAHQNAMTGAFQQGQGEQAQAWGQAFQGYQLPMAQLSAISPFYGAQNAAGMQTNQQNWMAGQNDLNRQFQGAQNDADRDLTKWGAKYSRGTAWGMPRGAGGGGGALTYDQQLGLLDRNFYNSMVLQGMQGGQQMPNPTFGSGAAQGLGTGAGLAIGSMLR